MSRQLKRVPLDFNWPLKVIWKGYLNPYSPIKCKVCDETGLNPATKKLRDEWYTHLCSDGREGWQYELVQEEVQALLDGGRLMDFTHTPRNEEQRQIVKEKIEAGGNSWLPESNGYVPTAEEVNQWARKGFGHDGLNQWICVRARAERLGVYGHCDHCKGAGHYWCDDKYENLWEEWERIDPPEGEGFQLWEDCSEGSPVSPVFKTLEELCEWAESNATTFGSFKASKEDWMKMLDDDYVYHKEGNVVFS